MTERITVCIRDCDRCCSSERFLALTRLMTVLGGGQLKIGGESSDVADNDAMSAAAMTGNGSSETCCFLSA